MIVKRNVVVNNNNNKNWGYDSFFSYNDNLVSPIPQMELAKTQQRQ